MDWNLSFSTKSFLCGCLLLFDSAAILIINYLEITIKMQKINKKINNI